MVDQECMSSAEPLLGRDFLAYQEGIKKANDSWRERELYWTSENNRLDLLEAAAAERRRPQQQAHQHPQSDLSDGRSDSSEASRQAVEGHSLAIEKQRSETPPSNSSSLPATADTLYGWKPRKAPRTKSWDVGKSDPGRGLNAPEGFLGHQRQDSCRETSPQGKRSPAASTRAGAQTATFAPPREAQHTLARLATHTPRSGRDLSRIKAQKKPREESDSNSSSPKSPVASSITGLKPPEWYAGLKVSNKRSADTSNADILLQRMKDQIATLKRMGSTGNNQVEMNELREMLHEAPFLAMGQAGPQLLRNKRMLHNEDGLPQIFDDQFAGTMKGCWPWDVQSDAAELYHKWCAQNFNDDMLFGLILASKSKHAEDDHGADRVDKKYKISSKYKGNGKLVNGQWWPTLLCVLRDGAHGDSQAGISGESGVGAYSCFMSGGKHHPYPDIDRGDVVEYYGQDATTPGQISRGTLLLMKNKQDNIPVRFIRSSKALSHSKYAPQLGFRYDGLYDVTSYELVDKMKERYKFLLVRQAGQGPIRGGNGLDVRPTAQEVQRYQQDKRFLTIR